MTVTLVIGLTWLVTAVSLAILLGRSLRLCDELESPLRYRCRLGVPQGLDNRLKQVLTAGAR